MAGFTLCVACAALPVKDRSIAVKRQRCPECKSEVAMTSYGARFRVPPVTGKKLLSANLVFGLIVGAALTALAMVLIGVPIWIEGQTEKSRTPGKQAIQVSPEVAVDLARIPEVSLEASTKNKSQGDAKQKILSLIEQIRQENAVKQDGFLLAQMDRRKELRGLPFIMGDACKMPTEQARSLNNSVAAVHAALDSRQPRDGHSHDAFWNAYAASQGADKIGSDASVAALAQILGPEHKNLRGTMVQRLASSPSLEASKVLARAAIFDPVWEVRSEALKALKGRPKEQYSDVLMQGIRYPLPIVAQRTGAAMILLAREDLLPNLAEFLGEAYPGDPVPMVADEQQVCVVREVVRINHHRNCLLCHAPAQTSSSDEIPGVVPTPGLPFGSMSGGQGGYGVVKANEPAIRADTTYLRQDFSVLLSVADAAPWPEMQRFDFLVRTRVVEGNELATLQRQVKQRPADYLSENHKAALRVLRELSGQDAAPNQAAWQRVLGDQVAQK